MLYKPKYCCNCAEKIERVDWNLLTSRRFCDVCAAENKRHDNLPRAAVAGGLLSLMFGLGTLFGETSASETNVRTLNTSPAYTKSENVPNPSKGTDRSVDAAPAALANTAVSASHATEQTKSSNKTPAEKAYYCGALTKKGTPCSRKVKAARSRCFQHEGKPAAGDDDGGL